MDHVTDGEKEKIEAHNARKKIREDGDLRRVLDTIEGRRFVWRVLQNAGIGQISFNTSDSDGIGRALLTAFKEGQRDIGNQIWRDILRVVPDKFTVMQKESAADYKHEQAELKKMMEEKSDE